jgi:hypothetical protein
VIYRGVTAGPPAPTLDELQLIEPDRRRSPGLEFLTTTPGRLTVLAVVLIAAALAAGAVTAVAITDRQQRIQGLRANSEPLADTAQVLYSSLSIADASATSAFLSGGVEPQDLRQRYDDAIRQATTTLVAAANGVSSGDVTTITLLAAMSNRLADYVRQVDTARANNRAGNPLGVAYLGQASGLMQGTILPLAERLYASQSQSVAATQTDTARFPLAPVLVAASVLLALVGAQVYLYRLSRRRISPGLTMASLLMAVLVIWLTFAAMASTAASDHARDRGTQPMSIVVQARILAQRARADETLALLRHGSNTQVEADFATNTKALSSVLGQYRHHPPSPESEPQIASATSALDGWLTAHGVLQQRLSAGDFSAAARIATGREPSGATAHVLALDTALQAEIARLRAVEFDSTTTAYRALLLLPTVGAALAVLSALFVCAGMWPRLNEYQ